MIGVPIAAAQEPRIEVKVDRNQIFLGESVQYKVFLNNFDKSAVPEFESTDDYAVRVVGKSISTSVSTTFDGSRTQRIQEGGPLVVYELTPKRAGDVSISGPTAQHDGKTLRGETLILRVMEPGKQDYVQLKLAADRQTLYPMQSFVVKLDVFIRGLPDPIQERDPLAVLQRLPTLSIPWAEDEQLASGIEPDKPRDRWLSDFADSNGRGLSINDYQGRRDLLSEFFNRDPFDMLGGDPFSRRRDTRIAFRPQPSRIMQDDLRGRRVEYWRYSFERRFVAREAGDYSFGPAALKGAFGSRIDGRNLELEQVYAIADAIVVSVREPPLDGRPNNYIGAIGQFDCGATISPSQAKVGDPMTLTIWLRGTGTLDRAVAPQLQDEPEIAEHFKVYDATEETDENVRKFTYSLRPKVAGVAEFPAVAMAYFDVDQEDYVMLRTEPVPIEVAAADRLQNRDIAVADPVRRTGTDIEVRQEGIFANVTELSAVRDERVNPERWFMELGGLAGLFLVLVAGKQQFDRRSADTGLTRRRKAAGRARQRLDEAGKLNAQSAPGTAADLVGSALVGLVADVCGISEQGLTSDEATRRLKALQANGELCDRYKSVLDECDAIRFGSRGGRVDGLVSEAGGVVDDVAAALRKLKHLR